MQIYLHFSNKLAGSSCSVKDMKGIFNIYYFMQVFLGGVSLKASSIWLNQHYTEPQVIKIFDVFLRSF